MKIQAILLKIQAILRRAGKIYCVICKKPITLAQLQAEEQEVQQTEKGLAHSDCCHEKIGELIEKHPIISARVRRG